MQSKNLFSFQKENSICKKRILKKSTITNQKVTSRSITVLFLNTFEKINIGKGNDNQLEEKLTPNSPDELNTLCQLSLTDNARPIETIRRQKFDFADDKLTTKLGNNYSNMFQELSELCGKNKTKFKISRESRKPRVSVLLKYRKIIIKCIQNFYFNNSRIDQ